MPPARPTRSSSSKGPRRPTRSTTPPTRGAGPQPGSRSSRRPIPGVYYILIRGHSEPAADTPVTVLAELLPLSITNVQTDQGGDSKYVTTTISGAQFQPNAIVKLVMPGFAEYQPLTTDFVNSTEIIAEFDLTGAPLWPVRRPGHQPRRPGGDRALPLRGRADRRSPT